MICNSKRRLRSEDTIAPTPSSSYSIPADQRQGATTDVDDWCWRLEAGCTAIGNSARGIVTCAFRYRLANGGKRES